MTFNFDFGLRIYCGSGGAGGTPAVIALVSDALDADPPHYDLTSNQAGTLYWDFDSSATPPSRGGGDILSGSAAISEGDTAVPLDFSSINGLTGYLHFRVVNANGESNILTSQEITTPGFSITYVPIYGQSLGYGTDPGDSLPVSTSAPPHLMFNAGVRAHGNFLPSGNLNAAVKPQNVASLVTLVEEYKNLGDPTETLATGISTKIDGTGLFATSARGSSDVDYLSKDGSGAIHYQHTVWFGARARDLALAAGYTTFNVPVIVWKQGEQDGFLGTTRANYKTLLSKLIAELRRDFTYNTLNDCSGMVMIGDQQSLNNAAYAEIAVAVLEMHRNDPTEFTLVGPGYQYKNYTGANDVHLTATGYRNVGEYFGRAVRTIQDGGTWHPCHITGVSRTGTSIAVTVHVPSPPLVVDTTYLTKGAFTDYGFTYDGATITNVAITDDGTGDNVGVITITIDADAGGNLKYAYNNGSIANYIGGATTGSSGGNIRDSESAVTDYDSTPLYNWLCIDDWSVA